MAWHQAGDKSLTELVMTKVRSRGDFDEKLEGGQMGGGGGLKNLNFGRDVPRGGREEKLGKGRGPEPWGLGGPDPHLSFPTDL